MHLSAGYESDHFFLHPPVLHPPCPYIQTYVYSCSFFREIVQADALKMEGSVQSTNVPHLNGGNAIEQTRYQPHGLRYSFEGKYENAFPPPD